MCRIRKCNPPGQPTFGEARPASIQMRGCWIVRIHSRAGVRDRSMSIALHESGVFNPIQAKAFGAQGGPGECPVLVSDRLADTFRRSCATSYFQKGAGKDPDHVVEETISNNIDSQAVLADFDDFTFFDFTCS